MKNTIFIPIGVQCLTSTILKKFKIRKNSYPFDWLLSNPSFVYTILKFLLESDLSIEDIVKLHFFKIDQKCNMNGLYNWISDLNGTNFFNNKYKVIFPHDSYNESNIKKYIRRFKRLKQDILNKNNNIKLIYISQSSLKNGNFTLNGEHILNNVFNDLNKIYLLVNKHNKNANMVIFDAIQNENINLLNKSITIFKITSKEGGYSKIQNEVEIIFKNYLKV